MNRLLQADDSSSESRVAPRVLVVTLNWNGRAWLGECLSSVLAMDYPRFEVALVDNGSTDDSVAFVRETFPAVHVVENPTNLGYARGFNRGLELGADRGFDFFLLMNNDTEIDRNALTALVECALSRPRAGFVTGKVYFHDRPGVLQTVGKLEHPVMWNGGHIGAGEADTGQYDSVAERPFIDDIFTLVVAELYRETGGYDPQFFLQGEEFDWQARAKALGWRFYYTPEAKLSHYGSLSMGGLGSPVSEYFFVRNHLVVLARNAGARRWLRAWGRFGVDRTRSLVSAVVRREDARRSRLAGWLGWAAGTLWLFHRRPATRVPTVIRALSRRA